MRRANGREAAAVGGTGGFGPDPFAEFGGSVLIGDGWVRRESIGPKADATTLGGEGLGRVAGGWVHKNTRSSAPHMVPAPAPALSPVTVTLDWHEYGNGDLGIIAGNRTKTAVRRCRLELVGLRILIDGTYA